MHIALCQFNPVVGDIFYNAKKIKEFASLAFFQNAELIIFPELSICGYPPKDLLFRQELHQQIQLALQEISQTVLLPVILGAPVQCKKKTKQLFWNAVVLCQAGNVEVIARKQLLPNYDVFDERRYFEPGRKSEGINLFTFKGITFGFSICEDAWNDDLANPFCKYDIDPVAELVKQGADIIANISASPFSVSKPLLREKMFSGIAKRHRRPLMIVGQVGANDQLIFDGHSMLIDKSGKILARSNLFEEDLLFIEIKSNAEVSAFNSQHLTPLPQRIELMSKAIVLGIKDYVEKSQAPGVLLGLSGGIDSAVVAALAVRALGADKVIGVRMPSQFSSEHSLIDAKQLGDNLGIRLLDIPIELPVEAARFALAAGMEACLPFDLDITDQNLQARMRSLILMGLSNGKHYLVLSTGNKSELAMGYVTLYGDMSGALAPLGDVYKTDVWNLARFLNQFDICIPENSIAKVPSAELKLNQCDQDTLPPYDLLDQVLFQYIDCDQEISQILKNISLPLESIKRIVRSVNANDHKRKQAAIILMVSDRVFGDGRRWPVVKRFDPFAS
jgi:NAD+ synthase (glutamine-hydrolysing)